MERFKSSDVLDVTHEVTRSWRGTILGHFRRVGPHAWDDYQFVRNSAPEVSAEPVDDRDQQHIEVLPTVSVQLETQGPVVRLRSGGRVVRLRWLPVEADREAMGVDAAPPLVRRYFIEQFLRPLGSDSEIGAAAVMARKLSDF